MIKIKGAWYIDSMPQMIVIERVDNTLAMCYLSPFRDIVESELKEYRGYHPRQVKGQPLPEYLYQYYDFEKIADESETASEMVHIRISPTEKDKVGILAKNDNKTVSEYIRGLIRGL